MSAECNLCNGSGVVSVGQACICQYERSLAAQPGSVIQVETIRLHDGSKMDVIRDIDKVMRLADEVDRLRSALDEIRCMAERYNYVGWQRIVGCMRKCADEALAPNEKGQR